MMVRLKVLLSLVLGPPADPHGDAVPVINERESATLEYKATASCLPPMGSGMVLPGKIFTVRDLPTFEYHKVYTDWLEVVLVADREGFARLDDPLNNPRSEGDKERWLKRIEELKGLGWKEQKSEP